jgi:hypothetical protein
LKQAELKAAPDLNKSEPQAIALLDEQAMTVEE